MMRFVSLLLFPLLCYGSLDWRGHNRAIGTTNFGSLGDKRFELSSTQKVLNHRSILLYEKDNHNFELAYELFGLHNEFKNRFLVDPSTPRFQYRIKDLNYFLVSSGHGPDSSSAIVQNLDRFFYTYSSESVEMNIGRQPIGFGSARTINPLDILVPFDFLVINLEQKTGVDAVRLKIPFSEMGMLDMGRAGDEQLKFGDEYKFFSLRETLGKFDVNLLIQSLRGTDVYGLDLQTDLFNWGIWLEGGYFNRNTQTDFARLSLGGQYHFSNDIDFFMEYHFNGADSLVSELAIFVADEHYFNLGGSYPITALDTIAISLMNNMKNPSSLLSGSYERNFSENWYVEGGIYLGIGPQKRSEFGAYPQILFASLKNYF